MKMEIANLRGLSEIARKLGVEGPAARFYLSFTSAMRSNLKKSLENLEFAMINPEKHDKTAFFPEFYARDYRTTLHGVIAHGLNYRGVGSVFAFGDESLDAAKGFSSQYNDERVRRVKQNREFADVMNLPSVFLDEVDYDDSTKSDDVESMIETYAVSSALHDLQAAKINYDDPDHVRLVVEYKRTGRVAWDVTDKLHQRYDFDYFVSSGSPYLPKRMALEYAIRNEIPITANGDPVRGDGQELFFSRMDGPLNNYISDGSWHVIANRELTEEQKRDLEDFMEVRMETNDYVEYAKNGQVPDIDAELKLYSIYTHLPWDAATMDVARVFADQYEWVIETIKKFRSLNGAHLIIKVHPAEKIRGTNEGITDVLESEFNQLPENVSLLQPDTKVSPYAVMQASDGVIVYTSTVGMEATYLGTPVVTVADSHYAGKGFTYDPRTKHEYKALLSKTSPELDNRMESLVRKYLYNYFIERPITFDIVRPREYNSKESIVEGLNSVDQLKPGGDKTLDNICRAIIENTSYFYTKTHDHT